MVDGVKIKPIILKKHYHHVDTTYIPGITTDPEYHKVSSAIFNFFVTEKLVTGITNTGNIVLLMTKYDVKKLFHLYINKHNLQKGVYVKLDTKLIGLLGVSNPYPVTYKEFSIIVDKVLTS